MNVAGDPPKGNTQSGCCLYDKIRSSGVSEQYVTIEDVCYRWYGGLGAILISVERDVKENEVRMICGIPFYAYRANRKHWYSKKCEIWWSVPQAYCNIEWIRRFKCILFGLE